MAGEGGGGGVGGLRNMTPDSQDNVLVSIHSLFTFSFTRCLAGTLKINAEIQTFIIFTQHNKNWC